MYPEDHRGKCLGKSELWLVGNTTSCLHLVLVVSRCLPRVPPLICFAFFSHSGFDSATGQELPSYQPDHGVSCQQATIGHVPPLMPPDALRKSEASEHTVV